MEDSFFVSFASAYLLSSSLAVHQFPLLLGLWSRNMPSLLSSQTEIQRVICLGQLTHLCQRYSDVSAGKTLILLNFVNTFYDVHNITVRDDDVSSVLGTRKIRASKTYFQQVYYFMAWIFVCSP